MAKRTIQTQPIIEPRQWTSSEEIDRAISKLNRRISELEVLNVQEAVLHDKSQVQVAVSNVRETIREVFGQNSPEFEEHEHIRMWSGPMYMGMAISDNIAGTERGRNR